VAAQGWPGLEGLDQRWQVSVGHLMQVDVSAPVEAEGVSRTRGSRSESAAVAGKGMDHQMAENVVIGAAVHDWPPAPEPTSRRASVQATSQMRGPQPHGRRSNTSPLITRPSARLAEGVTGGRQPLDAELIESFEPRLQSQCGFQCLSSRTGATTFLLGRAAASASVAALRRFPE
jgi:hypothetical protein